jgi:hypothetical protein
MRGRKNLYKLLQALKDNMVQDAVIDKVWEVYTEPDVAKDIVALKEYLYDSSRDDDKFPKDDLRKLESTTYWTYLEKETNVTKKVYYCLRTYPLLKIF